MGLHRLAAICCLTLTAGSAAAQTPFRPWLPLPEAQLPPAYRESVRRVMNGATVSVRSSPETFAAAPGLYHWLVDHPDRTCKAWRRHGVPCLRIESAGPARWRYTDADGTDVVWRSVARTAAGRVWYATGRAKYGVLPGIPVAAVAVLRHDVGPPVDNRSKISHQVDLYLWTDSRAARLALRLFGESAPETAKKAADQLLIFFSAVARHIDKHPEAAGRLLAP